jgi:HEAT repeat protein
LDDSLADIRMSTAEALGQIGSEARDATTRLIELSRNVREEVIVREYSIIALSRIAPEDEKVVLALIDLVGDGEPQIYTAAVTALLETGISGQPDEIGEQRVQVLIDQLIQPDPVVREAAASALGELGPQAADSILTLTEILADEANGPRLRTAAAESLGLIGSDEGNPSVPRGNEGW